MTQAQSETNLSTARISPIDFTSILKSKPSTVLLLSLLGLGEVLTIAFSIALLPTITSTDAVAVKTIVQPRTEIADNSKTCGDRDRGDGTFDCPT